MDKEFMNFKEATEYLNTSKSALYKMTSLRQIRFYKPKGKIFFKKDDLTTYITQSEVSVNPFNLIDDTEGIINDLNLTNNGK